MDEYERMFRLGEADMGGRILDCGGGPASFNAEMTRLGHSVVSCDPIYSFTPSRILEGFEAGVEPIMAEVRAHPENYVWSYHRSPEDLLQTRRRVLGTFIEDFTLGLAEGRYVTGELPNLPFAGDSFDLAVCSHLLFLYSNILSLEFHLRAVLELCRVAGEVRVFPVTGLDCEISPHLDPLLAELRARRLKAEVIKVDYQLQRDGDSMLLVTG